MTRHTSRLQTWAFDCCAEQHPTADVLQRLLPGSEHDLLVNTGKCSCVLLLHCCNMHGRMLHYEPVTWSGYAGKRDECQTLRKVRYPTVVRVALLIPAVQWTYTLLPLDTSRCNRRTASGSIRACERSTIALQAQYKCHSSRFRQGLQVETQPMVLAYIAEMQDTYIIQ